MSLNSDENLFGVKYFAFGEYRCANCDRFWTSNHCRKGVGQACRKCFKKVTAYRLSPMGNYKCHVCKFNWNAKYDSNGQPCSKCHEKIIPRYYLNKLDGNECGKNLIVSDQNAQSLTSDANKLKISIPSGHSLFGLKPFLTSSKRFQTSKDLKAVDINEKISSINCDGIRNECINSEYKLKDGENSNDSDSDSSSEVYYTPVGSLENRCNYFDAKEFD